MKQIPIKAAGKVSTVVLEKGLSREIGGFIRENTGYERLFVITDDTVFRYLGDRVKNSLEQAGIKPDFCVFPHGEKSKNLLTVQVIVEKMAAHRLQRGDCVLSLGGGVAGDIAGFAASVYMRGIGFIQMPTTLLAMIDASIGGKNGVDVGEGKNLAGTFWQPEYVLTDTSLLARQPAPLLREGAGEMLKYGVLTGGELFELLESGKWRLELARCAEMCIRCKAEMVEKDERDTGVRRLLNLGHTFGHAIEAASGFSVPHGRAVAMGIRMAFGAAGTDPARYIRAAEKCGLGEKCPFGADELIDRMQADKKRAGKKTVLILPRAIGQCEIREVGEDELQNAVLRGLEA